MKTALMLIIIVLACVACSSNAGTKTNSNDNYVVVLDLSDRIIHSPSQIDIDTNAIRAVFEKFERSVQRNIVVKSKDRFSVRIIPQKLSSLSINNFENELSIDMGKYLAAEKLVKKNEFKANFSTRLNLLYKHAKLGEKSSDFAGVDIWQYFNDQVNGDLDVQFNNKVLVLTDGYFDFEDKTIGMRAENQSTITSALLPQIKGLNWKKEMEQKGIAIIPVKLRIPAKWMVCGIQPKADSRDLLESEKLSYLWEKWLKESGGTYICKPVLNSSSGKVKNLILNNF